MKKVFCTLTTILFLFPLLAISQSNTVVPKTEEALSTYHEKPRESIFLHFNKTDYVQGEEIWFSGYVFNRKTKKPFKETTNIYVGIYDSIGNQLDKRLFLGRDGYLKGNFFLDSTYVAGNYYLKAQTNWMRNFKEDDSFVQKIKVLTTTSQLSGEDSMPETMSYDVQFLPEGGNLVEGLENNVGVKIINQFGYGVKVNEISVFDSRGNLVSKVETSQLGMSKFGIKPLKGHTYTARVKFGDGQTKIYSLPKAEPRGIVVRLLNNPSHDKVGLIFETNAESLNSLRSKEFYFLLHQDGKVNKIPVVLTQKEPSSTFFLERENLKKGVNIITLFDGDKNPILERMFFNKKDMLDGEVTFNVSPMAKDSIRVAVRSNMPEAKISVSVLPSMTKSYNPKDNIISALYLSPYLSGFIEKPSYYFQSNSNQLDYELDLLLLTQGWSRYDWNSIFYSKQENNFAFEDGVYLKGSLNSLKPGFEGQVLLHNSKYHGRQLIPVNKEKNKFIVTSFFPENDEELYLSTLDKRGKLDKPGAYLTFLNKKNRDRLNTLWSDNFRMESPLLVDNSPQDVSLLIKDKTILLDEVVVSEEVKKEPLAKDNPFVPAFLKNKVKEIGVENVRNTRLFTDLLRQDTNLDVVQVLGQVFLTSRRGTGGVGLVVNGIRQPNADIIFNLPTGQIESYWLDRLSRYEGVRSGLRETLYVFTRRGRELDAEEDVIFSNALAVKVSNGFEPSKKFYMPKYATFQDKAFESYGIVHWEPELEFDADGRAFFTIFDTGTENLSFFVEGMSTEGGVISSRNNLNVPSVN